VLSTALPLLALAVTVAAASVPAPHAALPPGAGDIGPGGKACVPKLIDLHVGSGEKLFTSHYDFDGGWAIGTWTFARIMGQSLWQHRGSAWCKVTGSAALDARDLQLYGVPSGIANHLSALQPPTRAHGR
jgi:hypothetical protein